MNRFAPLLLATSLGLLAACHSGMSNRDYLHENVASWNGTVSMVEQWTNGPNGESFHASLQDGKSMQQHRFGLKNAHKEIADRRQEINTLAHDLVETGLAYWVNTGDRSERLIVRGQSNLLDDIAAADLDRVRQLLDELENTEEIARLIDSAIVGTAP